MPEVKEDPPMSQASLAAYGKLTMLRSALDRSAAEIKDIGEAGGSLEAMRTKMASHEQIAAQVRQAAKEFDDFRNPEINPKPESESIPTEAPDPLGLMVPTNQGKGEKFFASARTEIATAIKEGKRIILFHRNHPLEAYAAAKEAQTFIRVLVPSSGNGKDVIFAVPLKKEWDDRNGELFEADAFVRSQWR